MKIKLERPIQIDGKEIKEIELNLSALTGRDIISADREVRQRGVPGLNPLFTQDGLLVVASKASGIKYDDLMNLSAPDFMEVTANVQNFLLGLDLSALNRSSPSNDQS